jgi:hypothetical protein
LKPKISPIANKYSPARAQHTGWSGKMEKVLQSLPKKFPMLMFSSNNKIVHAWQQKDVMQMMLPSLVC